MEIVVINGLVKAYRHSLTHEGMFIYFSKLCMWTTGRWGQEPGDLFETGLMSYECEDKFQGTHAQMDGFDNVQEFQEVQSINQEEKLKGFHQYSHQRPAYNDTDEFESCQDEDKAQQAEDVREMMKITMVDLEIRMFDNPNKEETLLAEDLFAESPKGQRALLLSIYFQDLEFLQQTWNPQTIPPIKRKPQRTRRLSFGAGSHAATQLVARSCQRPVLSRPAYLQTLHYLSLPLATVLVEIPVLNMYAYDIDYQVICKFFQENIGEQPQTVVDDNPQPIDIFNSTIWQVLDIRIDKAVMKVTGATRLLLFFSSAFLLVPSRAFSCLLLWLGAEAAACLRAGALYFPWLLTAGAPGSAV